MSLASELALDSEALGRALDTHEYLDCVVADEQEAARLDIRGVPAFVANRRVSLSGVQTVEDLTSLVERARLSA
jgi:predicted DsbA family dithiol-disulfide isomerase